MRKAFLILLGAGAIISAGVIGYTYYWANKDFDKQELI